MGYFNENRNAKERRDWFSRTPPWHRLDSTIIDALVDKFGVDPMFESFVLMSTELDLVRQYEMLNGIRIKDLDLGYPMDDCDEPLSAPVICSEIARILCEVGSSSLKDMIRELAESKDIEKIKNHYPIVRTIFEISMILNRNQIPVYASMAFLLGLLNRRDEALKYATDGIKVIGEMKKHKNAFQLSNIPEFSSAPQVLEDAEAFLRRLIDDFSQGGS